jgi:hypothetical protein
MASKRRRLLLASTMALAACGGGGDEAPRARRAIVLVGNSLASGYVQAPAAGKERLDTPPVRRLMELTGAGVFDLSTPGATAASLLAGAPAMSIGPFAASIARVPADVAVFWLGGVEAVLGSDPNEFQALLERLVVAAVTCGMRAVLVCNYLHPDFLARVQAINVAIRQVAASTGSLLVEVDDLPANRIDPVHLDDASSAATVERIAGAVTWIWKS